MVEFYFLFCLSSALVYLKTPANVFRLFKIAMKLVAFTPILLYAAKKLAKIVFLSYSKEEDRRLAFFTSFSKYIKKASNDKVPVR